MKLDSPLEEQFLVLRDSKLQMLLIHSRILDMMFDDELEAWKLVDLA
jgi:hypothetical protein